MRSSGASSSEVAPKAVSGASSGAAPKPEPKPKVKDKDRPHLVRFFTGPEMLDVFAEKFNTISESLCALQDVMDHTELVVKLLMRLRDGMRCGIIFDKGSFFDSSCVRQAARVEEIHIAGCQRRPLKLRGRELASMHAKAWILDEKFVDNKTR